MAIVKMNKFTLFALESQKESLLENIHKLGKVHFVDLNEEKKEELNFLNRDSEDKKASHCEDIIAKMKFSLDFINKFLPKESLLESLKKGKTTFEYDEFEIKAKKINYEEIYNITVEAEEYLNKLNNERANKLSEIEILKPWENFNVSFKEANKFKNVISFIGNIPLKNKETFLVEFNEKISLSYVEFVNDNKNETKIFVLVHKDLQNESEEILKKYGFVKESLNYEEMPANIIKNYEERIKEIDEFIENKTEEIKSYEKYKKDIEMVYEYYENELNKSKICSKFLKTDKVVVLEGWVPCEYKEKLEGIVEKNSKDKYYMQFSEPEEGEKVPILLKNNSLVRPFESITAMYSLPVYNEMDPTAWLSIFFFIFFGMMLSDAGYGFLIFIASIWALKKFPLEDEKKETVKMFLMVSISTMFFGIMYGSYFGNILPIKPLWIDPSTNPLLILIVSTALGVVQIYVGLGIKAYGLIKDGHPLDALFDVGFWYMLLTGIFMQLLKFQPAIGKYVTIIGAVGLLLTQGRQNEKLGAKIAGGFYGLYGITGYLGDILSYSRLLALGLATGLIASSFNLIISLLGSPVLKFTLGAVIFVIGHIFNLLTNALSAYVHSCRLQYLEFFGKFYEGGGEAFKPFKPINKFIKVINNNK